MCVCEPKGEKKEEKIKEAASSVQKGLNSAMTDS